MDSALSWRFAARRSAPSMVVPLISAATLSAGLHGSALRVSLSAPLVCVASFGKGTTIPCRTRLARNADKFTESINLTRAEYQGWRSCGFLSVKAVYIGNKRTESLSALPFQSINRIIQRIADHSSSNRSRKATDLSHMRVL